MNAPTKTRIPFLLHHATLDQNDPRSYARAARRDHPEKCPDLVGVRGRGMLLGAFLDRYPGGPGWLAGYNAERPRRFETAREAWKYAHRLARTPAYFTLSIRYTTDAPTPWHPPVEDGPSGPFSPRSVGVFDTSDEARAWAKSKGIRPDDFTTRAVAAPWRLVATTQLAA